MAPWPCTVPLRASLCEPSAFVVGQLVLQWGNNHAIMCKCKVVNRWMHEKQKSGNYLPLQAEQLGMSVIPKEMPTIKGYFQYIAIFAIK